MRDSPTSSTSFNSSSPTPSLYTTPSSTSTSPSRFLSPSVRYSFSRFPSRTPYTSNSSPITPATTIGDDFESSEDPNLNPNPGLGLQTGNQSHAEAQGVERDLLFFHQLTPARQTSLGNVTSVGDLDKWIADHLPNPSLPRFPAPDNLTTSGKVQRKNQPQSQPLVFLPIIPPTLPSITTDIALAPATPQRNALSVGAPVSTNSILIKRPKWGLPPSVLDIPSPSPSYRAWPLVRAQEGLPELQSVPMKRKLEVVEDEKEEGRGTDFLGVEKQRMKKQRRQRLAPPESTCKDPITIPSSSDTSFDSTLDDEDPKPFQCRFPSCGSSFARAHDRQRHLATHTGALPYICYGGCFTAYARPDKRQRHWDKGNEKCEDHHYDEWILLPEEMTRVGKPRGKDAREKVRAAERRWEKKNGRMFVRGEVKNSSKDQERRQDGRRTSVEVKQKALKGSSRKAKNSTPFSSSTTSTGRRPTPAPGKLNIIDLPATTTDPLACNSPVIHSNYFDLQLPIYPASLPVVDPTFSYSYPQPTFHSNLQNEDDRRVHHDRPMMRISQTVGFTPDSNVTYYGTVPAQSNTHEMDVNVRARDSSTYLMATLPSPSLPTGMGVGMGAGSVADIVCSSIQQQQNHQRTLGTHDTLISIDVVPVLSSHVVK
ncbi:hypothetical protein FRB98_006737 [Tulasnella sp. 332]|nr:hypothetical protein FRB98_006737 [Tulasnella sp. 332]